MKTNFLNQNAKPFLYVLLALSLLLMSSCTKDENEPSTEPDNESGEVVKTDGITISDLTAASSNIGILIDTREIAKKGYLPAKVDIEITANEGDYSQIVSIDEFTNLAQLAYEESSLSDTAVSELKEGVPIKVTVLTTDDTIIKIQEFSARSFRENGTLISISANDLPKLNNKLAINTELPYYIQIVAENERTNRILESDGNISEIHYTGTPLGLTGKDNAIDREKVLTQFYLIPVSGKEDTYYIKAIWGDFYMSHWLNLDFWLFNVSNENELTVDFEFHFTLQDSGNITMKGYDGNDLTIAANYNQNSQTKLYGIDQQSFQTIVPEFRLIPATVDWTIASLPNQTIMDPILPAPSSSFGVNSTLSNCGSGDLEQEIVFSKSTVETTTLGWEESIELTSQNEMSFSATISAATSVSLFGNGVDFEASATSSYTSTHTFAKSNSNWGEGTTEEERGFEVTRRIQIPSGSAVLAYDAYQVYNNVIMPFTVRYRVQGSDSTNGIALTGEEIKSQFTFNAFNGVITEIGSDFVEVSVRGTITLDELIDSKVEVREVESSCD